MKRLALALVLCLSTSLATARVISYAPYSDQFTSIGFQSRTTRHFLVVENNTAVVLFDTTGAEEPRTVFKLTTNAKIFWTALYEDEREQPLILIAHNTNGLYDVKPTVVFTRDRGVTLVKTALPETTLGVSVSTSYVDNGGPFTRGPITPVLIGNRDFPFVVNGGRHVYRVDANGVAMPWREVSPRDVQNMLIGRDATGTKFLVQTGQAGLALLGFDGSVLQAPLPPGSRFQGWITPEGNVYLQSGDYWTSLYLLTDQYETVMTVERGFAVPTHDYSGAWLIDRPSKTTGTTLWMHTPATGLEKQWVDPSSPNVEALIAGASGRTLLVQVHRPRPEPDRTVADPALAVWHVGKPAPKEYDELFLTEQSNKGFVHVDVDRVADGDPFVFDSGVFRPAPPPAIGSESAGGGDVLQEWGVVRASLRARYVLPGVGRTLGAFASNWTTDVTLFNPEFLPQTIELRFVPNGGDNSTSASASDTKTVTLNAREIRVIPDILGTMFGRVDAGALFLTPQRGLNAFGRTYTRSGRGTYGFGMSAIDLFAAASPRFPASFAGAFLGPRFRTNLTLTDTTGRGSDVPLTATGRNGIRGLQDVAFAVPADGQTQINNLETQLALGGAEGGLVVRPRRGSVVASVFAIDNTTNDPTYFPPDLSASVLRTIPFIGHVDGALGSQFRTDLYIYNPTAQDRSVLLTIVPWKTNEPGDYRTVYLKPYESVVISDAYLSLFNRKGVARLEFASSTAGSVRVTSRTYTLNADGGTYGSLTPPLNGFQTAATGETLEILGGTGDLQFRTNLGIVELNPRGNVEPASVLVEIMNERGTRIDQFTVTLPFGSGTQVNDLFRARGLGAGAALIRVTPSRGHITAFATVTDNATNDSTYLAPYLGEKAQ